MSSASQQPAARPLNEEEKKAKADIMPVLERDRVQLLLSQPFLGALAMRLELVPVVDGRLPTAATDGQSMFFNALFMQGLDAATRRFVMAHEIWHCAALHFVRRGNRHHRLWNVAVDHETNHALGQQGLKVPREAILFHDLAGKNAETVYSLLTKKAKPKLNRGPLADDHSPADSLGNSFSGPMDPDFAPAVNNNIRRKWPNRVHAAAQQQLRRHGTLPGSIRSLLHIAGQPSIPWQELLRRYVERCHIRQYQWTRPNRRFLSQGLLLPGWHHAENLSIAVAVDTSGSVLNEVDRFMAELTGILRSFSDWSVRFLACDAEVVLDQRWSSQNPPPATIEVHAGGGTSFQPVLDRLDDKPPSALVYLTDGYAEAPSRPDYPVLWAITHSGRKPAPWGELLRLPPTNES